MELIITPSAANSIENNGLFVSENKFFDKYKNELSIEWVSYLYWTNQNRAYGSAIANIKLTCLANRYNFIDSPEYQKFIN